ncbi:copper chaperone [Streptomyces pacificus]|uniref:Heavy-metal-associated domain-containing protein n=1 Tax=Streptomyces pacificus TaxID=2705029 RepID=A0A6A0AXV7_9ACTN|nr:copper chaperone [Streptomyces pacificus]GFH37468.1 heavy-metal-associated domain-containing protein [Streptomyces pacificus]
MSTCCTPGGSRHTAAEATTPYRAGGVGGARCQGVAVKAVGGLVCGLDGVAAVDAGAGALAGGTGSAAATTAAEPGDALDALTAETAGEAGYDVTGRMAA